MKPANNRRMLSLLGILFAFALIAAACGDSDDDSSSTTEASSETTAAASETTEGAAETTAAPAETTAAADDGEATGDDVVRLGIMGECEGAFGGFHEDIVAGATLALVNGAGATSNSADTALD